MTDTRHALALFDLITAHRITASLYAAAQLGLADALANGPCTAGELSVAVDAPEAALRRLLRVLVTIGVCRRVGAEQFELTQVGQHLAGSAPQSLKAWAIFEGEMLQPSWAGLIESIRSGKTRAELAGVASSFDLMARDLRNVETFNAAMRDLTRLTTPDVLAAYDFAGISRLIDVGGGTGELLTAILQAYPSLRGAVFDQAACASSAQTRFRDAGISDRAEFIAGDFFETIPAITAAITPLAEIGVAGHLVHVVDPAEETLPYAGRIEFQEMAGPLKFLSAKTETLRQLYGEKLHLHRAALRELARKLGWSFTIHRTDESPAHLLMALHGMIGGAKSRALRGGAVA